MLASWYSKKRSWIFYLFAFTAVFVGAAVSYGQSSTPVDCSSYVTVTTANDRSTSDPRTRMTTSTADVTLTNKAALGKTLSSPLHAVITINNATGPVTMPEAVGGPGISPYQKYYYNLSSWLTNAQLAPGGSVTFPIKFVRSSTVRFTYTVSTYAVLPSANQPPTANAGPNQTLTLMPGQNSLSVQLNGSGSNDPDGTVSSYTWTGTPTPAAIAQPTVSLTLGTHTFTLVVTDNSNAPSQPASVTIMVLAPSPNQPPVANAGAAQTVTLAPGQTAVSVQLDGSGSHDPDGAISSYTWSGTPTPAATAAATVSLGVGTYTFSLVVTDNLGATSSPSTVNIQVKQAIPPTLSVSPLTYAVNQDQRLTVNVTAAKDDGSPVTVTAKPLIGNASFSATAGVQASGTFVFVPDSSQSGVYMVSFTAHDQVSLTDTKTIEIAVNKVNHAPVISVPATATVDEGKSLMIPVTASDPDGDTLTFSGAGLPPNAKIIPSTGTIFFTPDYSQGRTAPYVITITASDGQLTASGTISLTVKDVPTGGTGQPGEWVLNVDPVESPSFQTTQRITGSVGGSGGTPVVPTVRSALITGMSPTTGEQGQTLNVALTGDSTSYATHFASGASQAAFGAGITVNSLTVNNPAQATANVTIAGNATVGTRSANIVTGSETAVSVLAFNVVKGKVTLSGRIVDSGTGQPIVGATVTIQGSTLTATTGVDGSFILNGAPSGQQTLLVNAPNHQLIQTSILAQTGLQQNLGDMKTDSTVFDQNAPSSVSLGSLVSRIFVDARDKRTFDELQQTVIDAIQFVGGPDLGVVDEYGNELNPKVSETPFFRLSHSAVETIAMHMRGDTTITLAELLWQLTQLWEWNPKPNLLDWLNGIQTAVNAAWASPNAPESRLLILLFNNGKTLSPQPPPIVPDLPLNELQASLIRLSLLMTGARAIDPVEIFQKLGDDYFQTSALQPGSAPLLQSILLAYNEGMTLSDLGGKIFHGPLKSRPTEILLAQGGGGSGGGGGQQIIAKAARPAENAYIGKAITLDARSSTIPTGINVNYQWTVTSSPAGSSCGQTCFRIDLQSSFVTATQQIVFFTPDVAGNYTLQLQISSYDGTVVSNFYPIKVAARHWPCEVGIGGSSDPAWSTEDKAGLQVPWLNVLCTVAKNTGVSMSKAALVSIGAGSGIDLTLPGSAFKGLVPKGLFGGAPSARAAADNLFLSLLDTKGLHSQTISSNAKVYETYLPVMMTEAKSSLSTPAFQKFTGTVAKEMVTGVLGYFQSQADELGKAIVYLMLDKVLEQVLNGMRPSPPNINSVDVISAEYDSSKKIALVYFFRSKEDPGPAGKKVYCENASSPGLSSDDQQKANVRCNADFYYRVWREANGQTLALSLAPEGSNVATGPVPTNWQANGEPLLFVDYNPPEGQVRYYVQARRIIGKHTVPSTTMWSEAEFFFTNYIVGSVCAPAATMYNFSKGLLDRAVDMLRAMKVQNSDFSDPFFAYVPRPFERPAPPVSLAADVIYNKVYAGIPITSSVFDLNGSDLQFAFNTGFKEPYQVGLAVDSSGLLYSVNSASEAQFGGRIFRWTPGTYNRQWFGAVTYYSTLLGYAHPSATQALYAGMNWGKERLFIIDLYSNSLLGINIPPNGQLPPGDLFHNVGQLMAAPPDVSPNAQSSMTISRGGDLLMTQGDNIFRFSSPGDSGLLLSPTPFTSLAGIDTDLFGNVYVADSAAQNITALPVDLMTNTSFHQTLASDPAIKSLYTIINDVPNPGELRVGSRGTALIWFDLNGYHSRQFGLSARVLDAGGQPLSFATISNALDSTLTVTADEYGVFHMPGLLSPLSSPTAVPLVITDTLKRTGTYRINSLARAGETFVDPIIFTPDVVPLPASHVPNTPPNPPVISETSATVTGGSSTIIKTNDLQTGGLPPVSPPSQAPHAPRVELVSPVNRLQTNNASLPVLGVVSDAAVAQVQLLVNGKVLVMQVDSSRQFSGAVDLQDGLNSIEAKATITAGVDTMTGTSGVFYVQKTAGSLGTGTLSGVVLDQATGYPVADVRVIVKSTGLYTYTDSLGVWFISDVPNGTYDVQIVP